MYTSGKGNTKSSSVSCVVYKVPIHMSRVQFETRLFVRLYEPHVGDLILYCRRLWVLGSGLFWVSVSEGIDKNVITGKSGLIIGGQSGIMRWRSLKARMSWLLAISQSFHPFLKGGGDAER